MTVFFKFFFLKAIDLEIEDENKHGELNVKRGLFETLIQEFSALPESANYDDYAVVNVGPSVVPNPYIPTFRIFSYNITEVDVGSQNTEKGQEKESKRKHGHHRGHQENKTTICESKEYQDTWRCHLDNRWYSDPAAPSRSNGRLTPLGYAQVRDIFKHFRDVLDVHQFNQYYLPGLEEANKRNPPKFKLEYLTYRLDSLYPDPEGDSEERFTYPVPLKLLPKSLRKPGEKKKSKYAPYEMKDLTIPSWVGLGRRLADDRHKKLRKKFRKYMFAGGEEELVDQM